MYAAIRQQTAYVDGAVVGHSFIDGAEYDCVFHEATVDNGFANAGEILIHHTAGTNVHVPHFWVAHLAVWQTHICARRAD